MSIPKEHRLMVVSLIAPESLTKEQIEEFLETGESKNLIFDPSIPVLKCPACGAEAHATLFILRG